MSAPAPFVENAPAKVNLTLRVLGRRADGYHELESLVAFAEVGDRLSFAPGGELALTVRGPNAAQAGEGADNLVLKAAQALAARVAGIGLGAFDLDKRLPVAAGLGGGSADAAAALRLLARANNIPADDGRLYDAARVTGADVPVCLDPRPRLMRGIGEILSAPLKLPALPVVLANPGVALPTKSVFAGWRRAGRASSDAGRRLGGEDNEPRGVSAASRHAGKRSRKRRCRRRAGDRGSARRAARPHRLPLGAHVRFRRHMLCALLIGSRRHRGGKGTERQISAMVGAPERARRRVETRAAQSVI